MNNQEIFNKVYYHLITQGNASISANGDCVYRGMNGMSCAVGCLISDEHYDSEIEGKSVMMESVQEILIKSGININNDTINLLFSLQEAHDDVLDSFGIEAFEECMIYIAKCYNLVFPED